MNEITSDAGLGDGAPADKLSRADPGAFVLSPVATLSSTPPPSARSALSTQLDPRLAGAHQQAVQPAPAIPTVWPSVHPVVGSLGASNLTNHQHPPPHQPAALLSDPHCTITLKPPPAGFNEDRRVHGSHWRLGEPPHLTGSLPTSTLARHPPPSLAPHHPTYPAQQPSTTASYLLAAKQQGLLMAGLQEIQPYEEDPEEKRAHALALARAAASRMTSGGSSRPMCIPHSSGQARTYRVAFQPSTSAPVNRGYLANSADAEVVLTVDAGDNTAGNRAQATSGSSQSGRTFLGTLFARSRNQTPDNSVHGAELLPHHYRQSPSAGGDTLASASLEAGSILHRATGALKRQPSMHKTWEKPEPAAAPPPPPPTRSKSGGIRAFMSVGNLQSLTDSKAASGEAGPAVRDPSLRGGNNTRGVLPGETQSVPFTGQEAAYLRAFSLPRSSSVKALLQVEAGDPNMSAADIAVLSSSLPTTFGGLQAMANMRRVDSLTSICSVPSDILPQGDTWMSHTQGSGLATAHSLGMQTSGNLATTTLPICLICLEMLTPQDFATGEAIQLQCLCKGDLAMRHRACAIEWSNVKGNLLCDICKHPIANLPEIDPAILAAREAARRRRQPQFAITDQPTTADYIFDGIRVAWVTVICCILFVDGMSVSRTFLIGASVGLVYCVLSYLIQWAFNSWRAARAAAALERQQAAQQQRLDRPHTAVFVPTPDSGDSLMEPLLISGGRKNHINS